MSKITIDNNTIEYFKQNNVKEIFITFLDSGCEGTKVDIKNDFNKSGLKKISKIENIEIYVKENELEYLENSFITKVGKKYIFKNDKIKSRCGCGSSFSFQKKLIDNDKLKKLKLAFKKSKNDI